MEKEIIESLAASLERNEPVALIIAIHDSGSSPGKSGAMMMVRDNGSILGSVGGGSLERRAIEDALLCMTEGESKEVSYSLSSESELAMLCGGKVRLFIKVFIPQPELVIVGCGHIGTELYNLGLHQGFRVVIYDERAELCTPKRFPRAQLRVVDDLVGALEESSMGKSSYVAIATPSHELDGRCLEALAKADVAYLGMIGSRLKIEAILHNLAQKGVPGSSIEKIFAPMGLNIGSRLPREIAMSIMSEILLVKNGGSPEHMRHVKQIKLP